MHHHTENEERGVNLSILNVSRPGEFSRVERTRGTGTAPDDLASVQRGGTSEQKHEHVFVFVSVSSCRNPHIHQTRTTTHDQLRHPCFGDHSRLVGLFCNLLHHLNQSIGETLFTQQNGEFGLWCHVV